MSSPHKITKRERYGEIIAVLARHGFGVVDDRMLKHETTQQARAGRSTGKARITPVCDGLVDDTFWLTAAHGHRAGWVRNIEANARVRVKSHGTWRAGTAHILDDDDPVERERLLSDGNFARALCLRTSRSTSTDLLTVRVDLDPARDESAKEPNDRTS